MGNDFIPHPPVLVNTARTAVPDSSDGPAGGWDIIVRPLSSANNKILEQILVDGPLCGFVLVEKIAELLARSLSNLRTRFCNR